MCVVGHAQNNKFAIFLHYLKENLKDEVNFLPADKHQRFLQTDTITLCVVRHAHITQNNKCYFFAIFKKVSDEVDFLQADKSEAKTSHFEIGE